MNPNKKYFNQLAGKWDLITNHDSSKIKTILEVTNLKKNKKILDIATGTGVLIPTLLKYEPKEIVALDISDEMIKIALKKYKIDIVTFINDDFYNLNLNQFDYAICYSAYPHFMDKESFIKKLFSVLVKNGRFVIAHSEGKEKINSYHNKTEFNNISKPLKDINEEAVLFKKFFNVDILVDTDELFILSGIKKADNIG